MIALLALLAPALADVAPEGVHAPEYVVTVDNLADYPDWVFVAYPTSNYGYGYVFGEAPISNLMRRDDWKGPATRLYATPKASFDRENPHPDRYGHGDHDEMVTVVPLPGDSVESTLPIGPPDLVDDEDPCVEVDRVYHIDHLAAGSFDLRLVSEVAKDAKGKVVPMPAQRPPEPRTPPPDAKVRHVVIGPDGSVVSDSEGPPATPPPAPTDLPTAPAEASPPAAPQQADVAPGGRSGCKCDSTAPAGAASAGLLLLTGLFLGRRRP